MSPSTMFERLQTEKSPERTHGEGPTQGAPPLHLLPDGAGHRLAATPKRGDWRPYVTGNLITALKSGA